MSGAQSYAFCSLPDTHPPAMHAGDLVSLTSEKAMWQCSTGSLGASLAVRFQAVLHHSHVMVVCCTAYEPRMVQQGGATLKALNAGLRLAITC